MPRIFQQLGGRVVDYGEGTLASRGYDASNQFFEATPQEYAQFQATGSINRGVQPQVGTGLTTTADANLSAQQQLQQTPFPAENIGNTTRINIPPVPPITNYNTWLAGMNSSLGAPPGGLIPLPTTPTSAATATAPEKSFQDTVKEMLGLQAPPVNQAEIYKRAEQEAGIQQKQQLVNSLTNQLNAITARSQADQLSLTGQGRGITTNIISGQQAEISKQAAIQSLPLAAQLSAAQNDFATAQGHLDKYFQLVVSDAQAQTDYFNKVVGMAYELFTKAEQKKLDDIKTQKATDVASMRDAVNNTQALATEALKTGNTAVYKSLTSLPAPDPASRTFAQDLINYNNKVAQFGGGIIDTTRNLQDQKLRLDIQKLQQELNPRGGVANEDLSAYGSQYADTGKLPSPAELKLSGLNVGQVSSFAKQMPKPTGALVSTNTGTKSSALSPTEEQGITALSEIVRKTLPDLKDRFSKLSAPGIIGRLGAIIFTSQNRQDYRTFRADFLAKLLVARSGGAVTEQEYQRYSDLVPTEMGNKFLGGLSNVGGKTLNSLASSMKSTLDNKLNTQQLSIYGYSKVKVRGVERTVGEILDIGGVQYKVLPDGTLTDII